MHRRCRTPRSRPGDGGTHARHEDQRDDLLPGRHRTPAQVYELATDTEFRGEVCEATHALDYDVSVDELGDDTAKVVVSRTMPGDVPDFIKKMIGEKVDVVQTEEWGAPDGNGQRAADIVLQIKGQPGDDEGHRRYRRLRRWCGDADRRRLEGVDPVHRQEGRGGDRQGHLRRGGQGAGDSRQAVPPALVLWPPVWPCVSGWCLPRYQAKVARYPRQIPRGIGGSAWVEGRDRPGAARRSAAELSVKGCHGVDMMKRTNTPESAADLLMLSGVVRLCPDCDADQIFMLADDASEIPPTI